MARIVAAAARAFDVLEVFLHDPGPLTVSDIGTRVDIPRSTLHELIHTLTVRGYLQADADGLRLGIRAFELGGAYRAGFDLARAGEEESSAIVAACGETSQVAVLDATEVVYIAKVDGTNTLRLVSEVGRRLPATVTGVGKAMLANLPPQQLDAHLPPGDALPVMTAASMPDRATLTAELDRTRERGYAIDDCESNIAVRCVAAVIRDATGGPAAAISVSVPTVRWTADTEAQLADLVLPAARRISARLGAPAEPSVQTREVA